MRERGGLTMTIIKKEQLNKLISDDYSVYNRTVITFKKNKIIFDNNNNKIEIDTAEEYKNKSIEIFSEYLIKDLQTLGKLKIEVEDKVFINGIIY